MRMPPVEQDSPRSREDEFFFLSSAPPPEDAAEVMLREFQAQQIELESQNEMLLQALRSVKKAHEEFPDPRDHFSVSALTLDGAGLIIDANHACASLLGTTRAQLLKRRFARFIAPESRDTWHRDILNLMLNGGRKSGEVELRRTDGARLQTRVDCAHDLDAHDRPRIRVALHDIGELHQARAALRIADVALDALGPMLVTDADGIITRVNPAFTRRTGYDTDEAVGQSLALLKSGHHDDAFYQQIQDDLKAKRQWRGAIWHRHKNGDIDAEWLSLTAVTTADGLTTYYVGTLSDLPRDDEAEAEILRLAYYDPLTGLPNRRLLFDRIGQAQAASGRSGHHDAVLFVDLDDFKHVNDNLGHDAGDQLLIEVARRLHGAVREGDSLARLSGDEFVLMLESLSADRAEAAVQAERIGEKVRESLARPYLLGGHEALITASIGITLFQGHDASAETLLKQADLALYQAKGAPRDRLRFFDTAMQAALEERAALEAELREALKRGQLRLYYQAQTDRARRVVGAEALLRWRHPKRGLIPPDVFIPLAEETGLIHPIGRWVLQTACAQLKAWSGNARTRDLNLTVNVSAREFRRAGWADEVRQVLAETGADPARLKIEVTEQLVVDNVAETRARMEELRTLGIGFSLDDFGAGHSLLSYLKRLPLVQLKIDRSFLSDLVNDNDNAAIVEALITLGQAMGLKVIAEGVETEAQLEFLDQHDCAHFQGNIISLPLPLSRFEKLLVLAPHPRPEQPRKKIPLEVAGIPAANPDARSIAA